MSRTTGSKYVFNAFVAFLLTGAFFYVVVYLQGVQVILSEGITDFETIASRMNVRNMVAVVYLGPRVLDTFLEVNVVILTVFGVKHIRSTS